MVENVQLGNDADTTQCAFDEFQLFYESAEKYTDPHKLVPQQTKFVG